jgi:hypothetical protein
MGGGMTPLAEIILRREAIRIDEISHAKKYENCPGQNHPNNAD